MSEGALALAFSAGAIAAFNPCGFALLPTWAAYLVAGEGGEADLLGRLLRALRAGAIASLAFLAVFGLAGAVVSAGFIVLGDYLPWIGLTIGVVLAALGGLLLVRGHAPGLRLGRRVRAGGDARAVFGFGVAYALASLSCVLPVFLLTLGIAAGEPASTRIGGFIGFALGMGTVLTLVAVGAALTREAIEKARAVLRFVPHVSGAVVLAAAVLVIEREIALAALSLGHHQPALIVRLAAALTAAGVVAALTLWLTSTRKGWWRSETGTGGARHPLTLARQRASKP